MTIGQLEMDLDGNKKGQIKEMQVPKNWGVRQCDLRKLEYSDLEDIFYGLHNLKIPVEILDIENPDEILAGYLASGILKKYNGHSEQPRDFLELVKKLNELAYKTSLARMAKDCRRRFPHKPGDLQKRLSKLDEQTKQQFVDSFFTKYRPSLREEPSNPNAFCDPNCDGHSSTVYVRHIYDFLAERYKNAYGSK